MEASDLAPTGCAFTLANRRARANRGQVLEIRNRDSLRETLVRAMAPQQARSADANWDDEGGIATLAEDWKAALALAIRAAQEIPTLPVPRSAPCGDGSVHLVWYRDRTDVTIERRGTRAFYSVATRDDRYLHGPCNSDDEAISLLRKYLG